MVFVYLDKDPTLACDELRQKTNLAAWQIDLCLAQRSVLHNERVDEKPLKRLLAESQPRRLRQHVVSAHPEDRRWLERRRREASVSATIFGVCAEFKSALFFATMKRSISVATCLSHVGPSASRTWTGRTQAPPTAMALNQSGLRLQRRLADQARYAHA